MAALALLKAPDRFKVGVSGSPVTEWSLYDTGYTERYMGTPAENPTDKPWVLVTETSSGDS